MKRRAFTLLEMLVVISIIVVLIGLLLPVASKVRQQAHAASAAAEVQSLSAAVQAYYNDFHSYPGPIPNDQQGNPGLPTATPPGPGIVGAFDAQNPPQAIAPWSTDNLTMSENLYLAMLGGLQPTTASPVTFQFFAGKDNGARSLNPAVPKKYPAYTDAKGLSRGHFVDGDGNAANDTVIPEFLDAFPDALPVLYLRARVGAVGLVADSTGTPAAPAQQYDLKQVVGYTDTVIGVGKGVKQEKYAPTANQSNFPKHGLRTVTPNSSTAPGSAAYVYPYDLWAALENKSAPATPRQKDAYILISAGIDRVYGTEDDITSFGGW